MRRFHDAQEAVTDRHGGFQITNLSESSINPFRRVGPPVFLVYRPGYHRFGPARFVAPRGECASISLEVAPTELERKQILQTVFPVGVPLEEIPKLVDSIDEESEQLGIDRGPHQSLEDSRREFLEERERLKEEARDEGP